MTQTRKQSFIEACANTFLGYVISLLVQLAVFPMFGAKFTFNQNVQIGLIFLIVSFARSYVLRRLFNWLHKAG